MSDKTETRNVRIRAYRENGLSLRESEHQVTKEEIISSIGEAKTIDDLKPILIALTNSITRFR